MNDNSDDKKKNYPVGYKKPPEETRFKPGQSGNPKGRPKGKLGVTASINKMLAEKVIIETGGKTEKINKLELLIRTIFKQALEGKTAALQNLLQNIKHAETINAAEMVQAAKDSERLTMKLFLTEDPNHKLDMRNQEYTRLTVEERDKMLGRDKKESK